MATPVVYGYIRTATEDPAGVLEYRAAIEVLCAREGWELGAVFQDVGSPLDAEGRPGFRGLLDAAAMPRTTAVVLVDSTHLSPRPAMQAELAARICRTGAAVTVVHGAVPEPDHRHETHGGPGVQ
ncbi:recombinase family protein [Actinokineospora globicatena]|uniref:recombinase family protein n=1 Tax=Actinokineospora globicatena TaxID=103729 RepID=UPI0020A3BB44|nr:recombinase family protein [Actinokineospora globicatena]MCP2304022.1 Resolvase, N terminal domain [Actinokineospora globicatena]GLW78628.1 hypothetical protein Aglo01_31100 [Actinokineospora globicatena]GLW84704.1 hypothetical protein Aglo02_23440 [Actinokineospora globicatena]